VLTLQTIPDQTAPCAPLAALDGIFLDLLKLTADAAADSMTMNDVVLWDSLRHMELITAIEQQFALELTFEEISTMQSIGAIRELVSKKTAV